MLGALRQSLTQVLSRHGTLPRYALKGVALSHSPFQLIGLKSKAQGPCRLREFGSDLGDLSCFAPEFVWQLQQ